MNSHIPKSYSSAPWKSWTTSQIMNISFACLIGALGFALLLPSIVLGAACMPEAFGVPGLNGPPNWFNTAAPAGDQEFRAVIDDPRWRGALKFSYGTGTEEEAAFRALYAPDGGNTFLYLSWHIKVDPSQLSANDALFVGFSTSAGALALRVRPFNNFTCKEAQLPFNVTAFQRTGVGTWGAVPTPSWANQSTGDIRIWASATGGSGFCANAAWAIHMRVPTTGTAPGIVNNLGTDFKLWYEARLETPPPTGSIVPGTVRYKWPRTVADVVTTPNFPDPTTWGADSDFHLSAGPGDAACTAPGVSLDWQDVGTLNNYPGTSMAAPHLILFDSTVPQASRPENIFRVQPQNNIPGFTIPPGGITAHLRIANWGSIATPAQWIDFPSGNNVTHLSSISPGLKGDLRTNPGWTLDDTEIATFTTGTNHRCMLVELSSNVPSPNEITFTNASVYRNMDFVPASEFSRDAEINIIGLPPASTIGKMRDVYLYINTLNMPAPRRGADLIRAVGREQVSTMLRFYHEGQIPKEQFEQTLPIYRVYVYHDTGKRQNIDGVVHSVLESQPSFGFFMVHDGMIEGWQHRIEGGANLQEINPRYYRLFVPNNGKATVKTIIKAVEPGGPGNPPPNGFKRWGLSLHAGVSIPHGNFNNLFNPGPNVGVDLEYRINQMFSLEGIYTFHRFNGETFGSVTIGDLNLHQLSANGKIYGSTSPVRPFFNFGGGVYHFQPSATHGGLNVGGGLQFDVTSNFAVDAMYNFHNVFTSGSNTRFSAVQGGVRFRF
jgi:hypothetical protein